VKEKGTSESTTGSKEIDEKKKEVTFVLRKRRRNREKNSVFRN